MGVLIKISQDVFTVTIASPAVFSQVGHGLVAGDIVYFKTTGALPTGIVVGTGYYIISAGLGADNFRVSATLGGAAINTSGTQSGVHTLYVDRTDDIMPQGFSLSRALTSQVDSVSFQMTRIDGLGSKPSLLDIVEVIEDGTNIFGGQITEFDEEIRSNNLEVFTVSAKDFGFDMDRFLVNTTFENTTVGDIVEYIKDNVLPAGYTTTNVDANVPVAYMAFSYEYPTKCLQQLAELVGYDWYVDANKNIYFKAKTATNAPFGLTDTNGKYFFNTLRIKSDIKNLRNTIYVRGGSYEGDTFTEMQVADGEATTYTQGFRYSNIVVTVDAVLQTLGVDNLHDPLDYDVLYNFQEKALKWRDDNKPVIGDVIDVTGNPHIPIFIKKSDNPSQNEHGIFEYKIIDKSINSRQGARDRADAELKAWKDEINEGSFQTREAGLDVSQIINVQSTIREIDIDFVITRIQTTFDADPTKFVHTCTLATTKTYGMIEFLQGLLIQKDKEIVIDENETIEIVINVIDTMAASDSLGTPSVSSPPYYWADAPVNGNEMVWNFFTWT